MPTTPYDVRKIFQELELQLIASQKRTLRLHEAEEAKLGITWTQWQLLKLQALGDFRKRNKKLLDPQAKKVQADTSSMIRSSFKAGVSREKSLLDKISSMLVKPLEASVAQVDEGSFFRINEGKVKALINATQGELRAAQTSMLRQADDVYRQTIFKTQLFIGAGGTSLNSAIDMATKDFLNKGYNCVTYANGRQVNIASYAEMALRTASQRAAFAGAGATRDQYGVRTVIISSHRNCSDLCLPYQGKVFVDDVYSGGTSADGAEYPLLSSAIAGGLFHPNCKHNMSTYYPGISSVPKPVDDADAKARYAASQKQRYYERGVQQWKRREAGAITETEVKFARRKRREWRERLNFIQLGGSGSGGSIPPKGVKPTIFDYSKGDIFGPETTPPGYLEFATDVEAISWLGTQETDFISKLTPEEIKSLNHYSGTGYSAINRYLLKGTLPTFNQAELLENIKNITSGINKFNLKDDIICYRTIPDDIFYGVPPQSLVGTIQDYSPFMSSTLDKSFDLHDPYKVKIKFITKRGTPGAPLVSNSLHGSETEFLYQSGTKYKILRAELDQGSYHLLAEVL